MNRASPGSPGGLRAGLLLTLILIATAVVYGRALAGKLVYDDLLLIGRNPLISGFANLPRLFTSGYWDFLGLEQARYIGYWRPLTALVQALIWPLAGSTPAPYHVACLAIHLSATAAAFLLARALSRNLWTAAATALLFAVHPVQVESVAWISALNDPLCGCLMLFSLERFLAWRVRGSRGWPLAAVLFFSLALLAKEPAAALVPLIFLVDLLRPRDAGEAESRHGPPEKETGLVRRLLATFQPPDAPARAYGPFALSFAVYMVARMLVFRSPWAGFDRITTDFGVGAMRLLELRIEIFGGGLEILTLPIELNLFRPFRPFIDPFDPALVRAAVFSAVFVALLLASLLGHRRLALTALLVLPLALLPALIRVQSLGVFPLSERFLYLPAFGFALGAALFLDRALARKWATVAVLVLGVLYGARTHERIGFFHDEETLFRRAAEQSPRSVYVQWGLGRVLLERRDATRDPRYLAEAEAVFARAEELLMEAKKPHTDLMVTSRDYLQVNLGYAWCYIYNNELSAAIAVLEELAKRIETIHDEEREARELGMRVADQFLDLEKVYTAMGVAQFKSKQYEPAEKSFQRALELQPASAEAHQNFGRMLAEQNRWERAAQEFEAAAKLRPGEPEDRLLLAQALQTGGKSERAEDLARALLAELPERPEPLVVLASGALTRQDSGAALTWLDRAVAIDPRNALAWYLKARAFLLRNEPGNAMTAFRNAVELDPTHFEAHYDCAAFLLSQGAIAEARPYLVRAYSLAPPAQRDLLRRNLQQMSFEEPGPLFEMASADYERNELAPALDWIERVLALAPEHVEALLMKARALRRLKRDADAVAAFRTCAERAPANYAVWSEFGAYLHELGRLEEARPVLEHALELDVPASWPPELRESSRKRLQELLEKASPEPSAPGRNE